MYRKLKYGKQQEILKKILDVWRDYSFRFGEVEFRNKKYDRGKKIKYLFQI